MKIQLLRYDIQDLKMQKNKKINKIIWHKRETNEEKEKQEKISL